MEEAEVVLRVLRRHAAVQERPAESGRAIRRTGVPGVAPAVAVVVAEVVRLPGHRRQHDSDPVLADVRGPDDERCEADLAVGARQLREVEPRRPLADPQPQLVRSVAPEPPVELDRIPDRHAGHHVRRGRVGVLRAGLEELHRQRRDVGGDRERRRLVRRVAQRGEPRVEPQHANHGSGSPGAAARDQAAGAGDLPVPLRVDRGDAHEIGARRDGLRRRPADAVPAASELQRLLPDRVGRAHRPRDLHLHPRRLLQVEADRGGAAQRVRSGPDRGQELRVVPPGEPSVAGREGAQERRRDRARGHAGERRRDDRKQEDGGEDSATHERLMVVGRVAGPP